MTCLAIYDHRVNHKMFGKQEKKKLEGMNSYGAEIYQDGEDG